MQLDCTVRPRLFRGTAVQPFVYRPEVDGLRAIAISGVFLFHLNHRWLPGGFVGVDVFFVISGYLITSILCQDYEAGRFSLAKFYQRRIARLFPAFFTVALVTLAVSWLVYTPQDFASAGANLVAASLSLANVKYMSQGNYFEISPDAQPFLHYWSLSVEEQFYLFFPVMIFLILRYARQHTLTILALFGVCSLAGSVLLTPVNPVWAFYLLPTRAWQLTAGCVVAVIPFVTARENRAPAWVSAAGLCLIAISFVLIKEGPRFPGMIAILPVVGAVAVILPSRNGWAKRLLSSSSMVGVGKVSYSLYLWHWPVFPWSTISFICSRNRYALYSRSVSQSPLLSLAIILSKSRPEDFSTNLGPEGSHMPHWPLPFVFASPLVWRSAAITMSMPKLLMCVMAALCSNPIPLLIPLS